MMPLEVEDAVIREMAGESSVMVNTADADRAGALVVWLALRFICPVQHLQWYLLLGYLASRYCSTILKVEYYLLPASALACSLLLGLFKRAM